MGTKVDREAGPCIGVAEVLEIGGRIGLDEAGMSRLRGELDDWRARFEERQEANRIGSVAGLFAMYPDDDERARDMIVSYGLLTEAEMGESTDLLRRRYARPLPTSEPEAPHR